MRDDAVSNVVGAILFIALVFLTITTIRVTHVPIWEEERESDHMKVVEAQMAWIKSEADRMADNRTTVAVGSPIDLMAERGSGIFREVKLPGKVDFVPGQSGGIRVSSTEMTILLDNGTDLFGVDENWQTLAPTFTINDIAQVAHMRIRLPALASEASNGDFVRLEARDRLGQFAGSFQLLIERDPPDYFLRHIARNASNVVVYDSSLTYHQESLPPSYFVNVLNDELQFRTALNGARKPLTMSLVESGINGEYTISYYEQQAGGGTILVGGSGRTIAPWVTSAASGVLVMDANNQQFPDQDRILEHGALILKQDDGAVFAAPPAWEVTRGPSRVAIGITMPALIGPADSVSKSGTATVTLNGRQHTEIIGTGPDFTVRIPTAHGTLWTQWWTELMTDAGVSASSFSVSSTATTATLTVTGPLAGNTHDVSVELNVGSIHTALSS